MTAQPSRGQTWRHKTSGEEIVLVGRSSFWGVYAKNKPSEVYRLDPLKLFQDYEFVICNHAMACCTLHGTHTSPHQGCVLR